MKAIEVLKKEHQAILTLLDILDRISERLCTGGDVPKDDLAQVLEFIRVFSDRCHHGKEEDLLFPVMERFGILRDGGPIGCMLSEHEAGREAVKRMAAAVEGYQREDAGAAEAFAQAARDYALILRDHIYKEDNILYPMGESHVPGPEMDRLATAFEEVETERIGSDRHEALHKLLERLKGVYLG